MSVGLIPAGRSQLNWNKSLFIVLYLITGNLFVQEIGIENGFQTSGRIFNNRLKSSYLMLDFVIKQ